MSIKLLAIELYRAQRDTARIEAQLAAAPLSAAAALSEELRQARAELQLLRKMLDDKKGSSSSDVPPVRLRCR